MDSTLDEVEAARVRAHLKTCDRCRTVYFDSARVQAAWDADSSPFEPTREQVDAAMAIAGRNRGTPRPDGSNRSLKRVPRGPLFKRLGIAAAAVVLAVVGWFGVVDHDSGGALDEQLLAPVRVAVETASSNGMIVYPGGENNLVPAPSTHRGGTTPSDSAVEESLEILYGIFSHDKSSRDAAFWLISGNLAAGRIKTALDFAREAHGLYPDDPGITTLVAVAAYVNGDLARAETLFREASGLAPDDPVALVDMSLVLIEQNKTGEARAILETVINDYPDTPMAKRAQQITEELITN